MEVLVKGNIALLWQPNVPVLLDKMLSIINFRLNKNSRSVYLAVAVATLSHLGPAMYIKCFFYLAR